MNIFVDVLSSLLRLFGFITRTPPTKEQGDKTTFACYVFECNASADEVRSCKLMLVRSS